MGKSRRNRAGASQRRDPLAKPVKSPSDPELAALREAKIIPIIRELQNTDPKSRSAAAAAAAVTNIIQDTRCRKLLLREQIVHIILTQTCADEVLESRAAGWRILQVLAQAEEADFCVHLFRSDILAAIGHAAKTVSEKLLPSGAGFSKLSQPEQSLFVSVAASLLALLTELAGAADDILEAISSNLTVIDFLFVLVAHANADDAESDPISSLRGDALACLMILTEENGNLAKKIVTNSRCYQAMSSLKDQVTGNGVLACATLHNVFSALEGLKNAPEVPGADDSLLILTLAKIIASVQPDQHAANGSQGWSNPVELQRLALETLASIGTTLNSANVDTPVPAKHEEPEEPKDDEDMDDADAGGSGAEEEEEEEEEEEGDDDDDDDEMGQDAMEADMEMVTGVDGDDDEANIDDMPVLKALLQTALPELIRISSFQPTNNDSLQLQGHALSALNNIAWSVSLVDFSVDQNAGIQKAWAPVGRTLWEQVITPILSSDTADVNLATQVTGLAWAVSRSLGGKTPLKGDEHRKFISLYQATKSMEPQDSEDPFQRLGVKCVGVLGQLATDPAPASLNREIGTFLITLLAGLPDTPAADAVEALNQVFDIYSSEEFAYDGEVFWKDNFLNQLEAAMPKARAMVKSVDKKTQPELRARADEAVMNLGRFLSYKKKNKPDEVNGS